jgi:hypothetical protein
MKYPQLDNWDFTLAELDAIIDGRPEPSVDEMTEPRPGRPT